MEYLLCGLTGYLLGCFNTACLVGWMRGVDIRSQGSRNPGASNVTITMGWRLGALVALGDILKAVAAVALCRWLFPTLAEPGLVAGVFCILGHMFPFYLAFRGGKGFASYLGMVLALSWRTALVLILLAALITFLTDYIAYATLFTAAAFPAWHWYAGGGTAGLCLLAALAGVILWKHRENLRRIRRGEETGLRKVPMGTRK